MKNLSGSCNWTDTPVTAKEEIKEVKEVIKKEPIKINTNELEDSIKVLLEAHKVTPNKHIGDAIISLKSSLESLKKV